MADNVRRVYFTDRELRFLQRHARKCIDSLKDRITKNQGDAPRLRRMLSKWETINDSIDAAETDTRTILRDEADDHDPEDAR